LFSEVDNQNPPQHESEEEATLKPRFARTAASTPEQAHVRTFAGAAPEPAGATTSASNAKNSDAAFQRTAPASVFSRCAPRATEEGREDRRNSRTQTDAQNKPRLRQAGNEPPTLVAIKNDPSAYHRE